MAETPTLEDAVREFLAADEAVDREAVDHELEGRAWSSGPVVRREKAKQSLRIALSAPAQTGDALRNYVHAGEFLRQIAVVKDNGTRMIGRLDWEMFDASHLAAVRALAPSTVEPRDDTAHLLSSAANAARLNDAIAELDAGGGTVVDMDDLRRVAGEPRTEGESHG